MRWDERGQLPDLIPEERKRLQFRWGQNQPITKRSVPYAARIHVSMGKTLLLKTGFLQTRLNRSPRLDSPIEWPPIELGRGWMQKEKPDRFQRIWRLCVANDRLRVANDETTCISNRDIAINQDSWRICNISIVEIHHSDKSESAGGTTSIVSITTFNCRCNSG
jgi:hypothetical protein